MSTLLFSRLLKRSFHLISGIYLSGSVLADLPAPATTSYLWRNVEVVGGGFVPGLVYGKARPDLLFARTDIGGAYRWNPTTKRWMPLTDWLSAQDWNLFGIESIATDPTDPNRVYLAAGTYLQSWATNGAILRSSDGGKTFARTDLPFKLGGNEDGRSIGERLSVDPNSPNIVYFGTRTAGLWRSSDYATTWRKVETFPATANPGSLDFVLPDTKSGKKGQPTPTLYVGVVSKETTLYRSRDSGATWSPVPSQPPLIPHHAALDVAGTLYITYSNAPGPNGASNGAVWKFNSRNDVWTEITPVKPGSGSAGTFGYAGLALDEKHPGTLMVSSLDKWSSGDDIYRSKDGGAHWISLKQNALRDSSAAPFLNWNRPVPEFGHWIGDVEIDPFHSNRAQYVTGATIWSSDDIENADRGLPTHWKVMAQGLEETAVLELISPPKGAHLISAMGDIGGFRHDDLTVSPKSGMRANPTFNTTTGLDFAEKKPSVIVRTGSTGEKTSRGSISQDGGTTWQPFPAEPEGSKGEGTIAISADGGRMVWTPRQAGAFVSENGGSLWRPCAGLPEGLKVVSDRVNPMRFYAFDSKTGTLHKSDDGGVTFSSQTELLPKQSAKLRLSPEREGEMWLASEGGLFLSEDGGKHFVRRENVVTAGAIGLGKAAPGNPHMALYLTGKIKRGTGEIAGVFCSEDRGETWVRINDDAHQYGWLGQSVTGDPRIYGRVYIATNGRGILYADPVSTQKTTQK